MRIESPGRRVITDPPPELGDIPGDAAAGQGSLLKTRLQGPRTHIERAGRGFRRHEALHGRRVSASVPISAPFLTVLLTLLPLPKTISVYLLVSLLVSLFSYWTGKATTRLYLLCPQRPGQYWEPGSTHQVFVT